MSLLSLLLLFLSLFPPSEEKRPQQSFGFKWDKLSFGWRNKKESLAEEKWVEKGQEQFILWKCHHQTHKTSKRHEKTTTDFQKFPFSHVSCLYKTWAWPNSNGLAAPIAKSKFIKFHTFEIIEWGIQCDLSLFKDTIARPQICWATVCRCCLVQRWCATQRTPPQMRPILAKMVPNQCYTCTMDVEHTKWWNWQGVGEFHHPNLSAWSTNSSNSTNGTDGKAAKQEMYKARIDNYMEILAAVSGSDVTVVTWPTFSPNCYCMTQIKLYTLDNLSSSIICCMWVCQGSVSPDQISAF